MTTQPGPLERWQFETGKLMTGHPPVWRDRNKKVVFGIGCPPGCVHGGRLDYSRWPAMPLPDKVDLADAIRRVEGRENHYDYAPVPGLASAVEWHVNFADPCLFVAYGSSLLAQDEMQVAEHPALGALREALDAEGLEAMTVSGDQPTPVLVMGAERRCRIATDRDAAEGRPNGLYGNAFSRAPVEAVRRAVTRIDPPTVTNLIAMAAPCDGDGPYSQSQVRRVLDTAYTGFRAAAIESARHRGGRCPVVVHSGFWGCGAFGGNRVLMAALQALSAGMAGLDRLVMHAFDAAGTGALKEAMAVIGTGLSDQPVIGTGELVERIVALGFEWGVSDGN
ncbi:MAG: hypothetical protein E4G90_01965 [Gemmatimonadales bacterium]|nr:MAG: hypothetical protein E4G90_01965 [Gemmatimonadales bacterium]